MSARSMLLITGVALLPACTAGDEAVPADTAAAAPNVVSLTAAEYTFQAPDGRSHIEHGMIRQLSVR
ncbi:MAG TPA: hypothetical protein VGR37_23330 [Longimicrobiaceae bacterium]|nr:hypothetical protein [Longimicrobiaceae bacterium]